MVNSELIRRTVRAYVDSLSNKDWKSVTELFAENGWVEDPVGTDKFEGLLQIEKLYRQACERLARFELTGPICVAKHQVAFPLLVGRIRKNGDVNLIDVIDVMTFDEDGKITTMRAFWQPEDMRMA